MIVDDILDTGGTLLSAWHSCAVPAHRRSRSWPHTARSAASAGESCQPRARRIQLTDTIPDVSARVGEAIEVLSITPLLLEALRTRPGLGP